MKKIFGISLALFAGFAIVFFAFRPVHETEAVQEEVALAAATQSSLGQHAASSPAGSASTAAPGESSASMSSTSATAEAASPGPNEAAAPAGPRDWLTHFKSGQRSYSKGDYADACRSFGKAVEENGDNYYLHYMLGLSRWKEGRIESATDPLNRCLELRPTFVKAWVNLARVRRELGDPQEAVALCEKALNLDGTNGDAWNVSGLAHLDNGDRDLAIECFINAISADAENAFALNNLGLAYIYAERFEEAVMPLEEAVDLAPDVAFIRNNLGVVYERLGRAADAARQYAAAMDAPEGHSKAEQSLKRVLPLLTVEEETTLAEFYQVEK